MAEKQMFLGSMEFDDGEIEVTSFTFFDIPKGDLKRRISQGVDYILEENGLDKGCREVPLRVSRDIEVSEDALFEMVDNAVPISAEEFEVLVKFGFGPSKQWDVTKQLVLASEDVGEQ